MTFKVTTEQSCAYLDAVLSAIDLSEVLELHHAGCYKAKLTGASFREFYEMPYFDNVMADRDIGCLECVGMLSEGFDTRKPYFRLEKDRFDRRKEVLISYDEEQAAHILRMEFDAASESDVYRRYILDCTQESVFLNTLPEQKRLLALGYINA